MTELEYPHHAEAWDTIDDLSKDALQVMELSKDEPVAFNRWFHSPYGFTCLLVRPVDAPTEDTVYRFSFEKDDPRQRQFPHEGVPFISRGLLRPDPHVPPRHQRPNGILEYSQSRGLVKVPTGELLKKYITIMLHKDITAPEQAIEGFENVLKTLLGYADRGWEVPLR